MKISNLVEHRIPKIKIHFKFPNLNHLTKIQNPTHPLVLGITVESPQEERRGLATNSPPLIFHQGNAQIVMKIYLNQYIKLAEGFSLDCFTS